mmetsp:Transcript_56801/g.122805  ORF Transcript_56801/g.122805 Transcript_56801/m.122805 type:complete len:491 (+) Transcript_56801:74-1546(+)
MDLDGDMFMDRPGSRDPFGSSLFDPGADFAPSMDASLDSSADASLPDGSGRRGQSLVFGGGGEFLSKYQSLPKDQQPQQQRPGSFEGSSSSRPRQRKRVDGEEGGRKGSKSGPAPDRVNVQLNSMLVHSRTVDKILQVVEAHFDHFNAVNLITALHRLATVVLAARRGALRRDVRFKLLIHKLSDTLRNSDGGVLKPQDLSNVAWALTKLGLLNAVLFGNLSDHIMRTIQNFEPVNLSMTLWAFARSGFLDEKLFRAAAAEVKRQLPDFQPQQIANTTWAMAKSGFVDEELFLAAANLALEKLGNFQPMNYSMLLYSFALARLPHPKLFEEVGRRCTVSALSSAQSAPHVVTNLALAFSEAGVVNPAVFDTLAQVASTTLAEFRTQQIATLAQAFARAEIRHNKLFASISDAVVARLAEFKQQDLQDLLSSYEVLGASTAVIAKAVQAQQSRDTDSGSNIWSALTAIVLVLLVVLIAWRVKSMSQQIPGT